LAVGDIDGDGKADLAISNAGSSTISILRNTATNGIINSSSFAAKLDYPATSNVRDVAIGDLDGDGIPDIAAVNTFSTTFSVFRNSPNTTSVTFASSSPQTLTMCENATAVDIKGLLHANDPDAGPTEIWSQSVAPAHGTLTFTSATASSGSTNITPGGTILIHQQQAILVPTHLQCR